MWGRVRGQNIWERWRSVARKQGREEVDVGEELLSGGVGEKWNAGGMPIKTPEGVVRGVEYGRRDHSLTGIVALNQKDKDSNEGQWF